jgi:hypothetical protein
LEFLCENYGSQYENTYLDLFLNNDHWIIRESALDCLLDINYPGIKNLLYQQLRNDDSDVLRINICKKILNNFGKPVDLKTIVVYQPTEQVESARELMGYLIQFFIPPRPIISANKMIDTLRVYADQLYQYDWITDYNTYLYYLSLLKQPNYCEIMLKFAKRNLININTLLTKVEADLSSGLLSEEGYKFMHYYSIYIKEELQKIIDGSTLRIK